MTKLCEWCGEPFDGNDGRRKYCSVECRHEYFKKYQREYLRAKKPKPKKKTNNAENRFCKICGKEFIPSIHNKVYCSAKCRDKHRRGMKYEYKPQPVENKTFPSKGINWNTLSPEEKFFYGRTQEAAYKDELRVIIPRGLTKAKYRDA